MKKNQEKLMKLTKSNLKRILNSKEFKKWLIQKRWFADKSRLSHCEFTISFKYYKHLSENISICIIMIRDKEYIQEYFMPLISSQNLENLIILNYKSDQKISEVTNQHIFNTQLINGKELEIKDAPFLIEGEYTHKFWDLLLNLDWNKDKFTKFGLNFLNYSEKKNKKVISSNLFLSQPKSEKNDKKVKIKNIGHGNTTNLLFQYIIFSNKESKTDQAYLFKCYKKYEKNIEPEILRVLKNNNFAGSPDLYGEFQLEDTPLICILEYIKNEGNIGSIFWSEINKLTIDLVEKDEFKKNQKENHFLKESIYNYCHESIKIAKEIGYKIKAMHNALIVKKREHFKKKKIVKEKFLKSYSKVLTELINNILQILNEDRALTYKFLEISQIQELLKQCKDRIVQFSQKQSKKIIKIQRIHQDLHMEQVLYNKIKKEKRNKENGIYEYYFLDFEGDPQFSLEQKQEKYPVERDMATFIRSLSYIKYNTLKDRINQIFKDRKSVV